MSWIKFTKDEHLSMITFGENAFVHGVCEWRFSRCNWYTFHLIEIELENDAMLGGYEGTFILLGLGFRWRWNHSETETSKEIERRVKEVKDQIDGEAT